MTIVIAVANQKGGVGKTTTTANLGASLAELGQQVLLIDLDPQGNLTAAVGADRRVKATVAQSLLDRDFGLPIIPVDMLSAMSIVPASIELAVAEDALGTKLGRELRLRDQILRVADRFDPGKRGAAMQIPMPFVKASESGTGGLVTKALASVLRGIRGSGE